jgi:hypothetical protein
MTFEIPEVSALSVDQSELFIRQLCSMLKSNNSLSYGSGSYAKFDENGHFITGIYHSIQNDFANIKNSLWLITQDVNGKILSIEIVNEELHVNNDFKDYANNIIRKALFNTLSDYSSEFFCRNYYCFIHTSNLDGAYWINNKLRIAPLYPNDNELGFGLERVIVVDQLIKAVDFQQSMEISEENSILLTAHLSLLFDIGFYEPEKYTSKWVRIYDEKLEKITNKRVDLGVLDNSNQLVMPNKKTDNLSRPIYSVYHDKRDFNEQLSFPFETRKILKSLENADLKNKLAFDRCCRLYQTALVKGNNSPTIKFSYLYGSVDAICQTTGEFKGFSKFMQNYCSQITEEELNYIHGKIRSSHWHSGMFILGENESKWRDYLLNKERLKNSMKIQNLQHLIRDSILRWVFEKIVKE